MLPGLQDCVSSLLAHLYIWPHQADRVIFVFSEFHILSGYGVAFASAFACLFDAM